MIPVVTPREMAAIDAAAPEPVEVLIGRAGRAVTRAAIELLGGTYGRTVSVIAGGGNNGADGLTAADSLERAGLRVHRFRLGSLPARLPPSDLVIDAAFGTGYRPDPKRPWVAPEVGRAAVLAVDVPSGADALTGEAGPGVLGADATVTFQALKPGLLFGPGSRLAGVVIVADIGLDVSSADQHLVGRDDVGRWWPHRRPDAHKWIGAVRIVAGSPGMLGAARLSAEGAARSGAGLVSLSTPGADPGARSEVIQHEVPLEGWAGDVLADLDRFAALVCGPGLGRSDATAAAVRSLVGSARVPLVLDGDGLNAVAEAADDVLHRRPAPTVLTPHDGEFARLHGSAPGADRVASARQLAARVRCTVLLKGPATVVADPDGRVLIVNHGDQRLATAGSGDVLSGIIGAALAGGARPLEAAAAGAWLHADAARRGPAVGLLAGDLGDLIPVALSALR